MYGQSPYGSQVAVKKMFADASVDASADASADASTDALGETIR